MLELASSNGPNWVAIPPPPLTWGWWHNLSVKLCVRFCVFEPRKKQTKSINWIVLNPHFLNTWCTSHMNACDSHTYCQVLKILMFRETFLSMSSTSVYFYNTANVEVFGFPAVQLKPPFFWGIALHNCVTCANHFETTMFPSEWWAPITQCHFPEQQSLQTQSFFKHIFLIIKF